MLIGELAQRSGLSRDTIRYYQKLGLLPAGQRGGRNDYQRYGSAALSRLEQIRHLKAIGFSLRELKQLLGHDDPVSDLAGKPAAVCAGLPQQLARKLEKIEDQLARLSSQKAALQGMLRACNGVCGTQDGLPDCVPPSDVRRSGGTCC